MSIDALLEKCGTKELAPYEKKRSLPLTHVPFSGHPRKHSPDLDRIILIPDPFSSATSFYEFNMADIDHAEKLPSIVTLEGETLTMVRLWVKKGSLGLLSTPFVVEDTRQIIKSSGSGGPVNT
ncbi:MAG: inorganic pyrophosphatase Ppa [Desulfatibacillaceae bacterium]|nr:inorganic pyrophosphatase Ppa [Desulfatibacillaceae bacterium]